MPEITTTVIPRTARYLSGDPQYDVDLIGAALAAIEDVRTHGIEVVYEALQQAQAKCSEASS